MKGMSSEGLAYICSRILDFNLQELFTGDFIIYREKCYKCAPHYTV